MSESNPQQKVIDQTVQMSGSVTQTQPIDKYMYVYIQFVQTVFSNFSLEICDL